MMRLGLIGGTAMTSLATSELDVTRSDEIVVETKYGSVPLLVSKAEIMNYFS